MAEFYINTETITRQSSRLTETGNSVRSVQTRVAGVINGLSGIGLGQVVPAITALETRLSGHVGKMNSLSSALGMSMLRYIAAESDIMGIPFFLNPAFGAAAGVVAGNTISGFTGIGSSTWEGLAFGAGGAYDVEYGCVVFPFLPNATYTWDDGVFDKHELTIGVSPQVSAEMMSFGYMAGANDDPNMVHLFSAGVSESVSVWADGDELSGQYGSLKGEYGVLNAEARAGVYAGLFDTDGNFAPGIGAEARASVSVFKASGEARLGNDYYGVYAKAGVEVLSAEASAAIDIGLFDKDGNFNPSFGAGVDARAVLAQATGSVGQRIMGTDIGVQGSIGVGVGAKAQAGFQDGKLSLDLGLYVGVGGSVSVELDFSDTYDTMVSAWNDATEFASNAWDATTEFASNAWDATTDFVSDAWDATTDFASNAWDTATDMASDAWDFITFWD